MTFRICFDTRDGHPTLHLEGRLGADEVPELERSAEDEVRAIDLTHLVSFDEEGLAVLRRLRDRGIALRNPSRYLAMRLG